MVEQKGTRRTGPWASLWAPRSRPRIVGFVDWKPYLYPELGALLDTMLLVMAALCVALRGGVWTVHKLPCSFYRMLVLVCDFFVLLKCSFYI